VLDAVRTRFSGKVRVANAAAASAAHAHVREELRSLADA
jgi:hypothetical protein